MDQKTKYSEDSLKYITATAFWMEFVATGGFILIGLVALVAYMFRLVPGVAGLVAILIYAIPATGLYRAARAVAAIPSGDRYVLEPDLKNRARLWRFLGVLVALPLILLILLALLFVLGGGFHQGGRGASAGP